MREEYDFSGMEARKNPYAAKLKKQVTLNLSSEVIDYFKEQSAECGIPYQTLINFYLSECVASKKKLHFS